MNEKSKVSLKEPTLKELNEIRKTGFRPNIVCCYVNDHKLLLAFNKELKLWQLPQGGVENGETPPDAIKRETMEEMGQSFFALCEPNYKLFWHDKVEFLPEKYNVKELKDDEGNTLQMIGKEYFYYIIKVKDTLINVAETAFDECCFLNYKPALFLAEKIYQRGKRRTTVGAIEQLKKEGVID